MSGADHGAPALEVRAFERRYSAGAQIGPISFSIRKREFASLLGPSGCGKTTILRAIAGFEPVDGGEIRVNGRNLNREPPHRRGVGLVFQSYALFPHLSVFENVAFGLRLRRVAPLQLRARVMEALTVVGLESFVKRMPAELSGGQQQRVAIARSLVLAPDLLLLDEPLSNLDYKLRLQMREELRAMQRRLGLTVLYVTHDQSEALALSDTVMVLSHGRLEQHGTPSDVYHRPRTRFIADFIGSANVLEATVIDGSEPYARLRLANGTVVMAATERAARAGDRVWLCVRPEDIALATHFEGRVNRLSGRPHLATFLGDRMEVRFELDGEQTASDLPSTRLVLYVPATADLSEVAAISFPPEAVVILEAGEP